MKMEDTVAKKAAECATFEDKDKFSTINRHYMTQKHKFKDDYEIFLFDP